MNQKNKPLCAANHTRVIWLLCVLLTFAICETPPISAGTAQTLGHNTPAYVLAAKNLGAADTSQDIDVILWLNPHNRSQLDALAAQLYDRNSPNYRHWLKPAQLAAFMPTAAELKTVRSFVEAHNLKVTRIGANNFYLRVRGSVDDFQKAFQVKLNNYQVLGKVVRSNDRDPYLEGPAGALVMAVSGLDSGTYQHPVMSATGPANPTGGAIEQPRFQPNDIYSNICFDTVEKETFSTFNNGTLPIGTYQGNHLNLQTDTSSGCGYTPPMIQAAYNLNGLYNEGYDGAGQTIGIIDWCGEFTIQSDANAFSAQYGLPQLTSSNFAISNIPGPTFCEGYDDAEINIDVEWAHAIAPGASINLIVPPTSSFSDIDEAEYIALTSGFGIGTDIGSVLSGSYGSPESLVPAAILDNENLINQIGAVMGISVNFSSGDDGDFSDFEISPTVSAPADSPWATGVGGITLALNADNSIAWQAGWGNNETFLAETGFVFDPPLTFSFTGGAGGGPSNCAVQNPSGGCLAGFPKPPFQKRLPGSYRQVPDISWLADPYTGVAILVSIPNQIPEQVWQIWGGTSVACPMFSALWAIANQEALAGGGSPLGQAAAYVYMLPSGAVYDIVPVSTPNNVTAVIQDKRGTTKYTAAQVVGGPRTALTGKFVSAIWDYPYLELTSIVISFGTDCFALPGFGTECDTPSALHTKTGWDNVTGVGTPNAQAFADYFFGK